MVKILERSSNTNEEANWMFLSYVPLHFKLFFDKILIFFSSSESTKAYKNDISKAAPVQCEEVPNRHWELKGFYAMKLMYENLFLALWGKQIVFY